MKEKKERICIRRKGRKKLEVLLKKRKIKGKSQNRVSQKIELQKTWQFIMTVELKFVFDECCAFEKNFRRYYKA